MNFVSENMNVLIIATISLLALLYFISYYVTSCVTSELSSVKKRVKKMQFTISKLQQKDTTMTHQGGNPKQSQLTYDDNDLARSLRDSPTHQRDSREREQREPREPRDPRDPHESREPRELRESRETRDLTEIDGDSYFDPTK